MVKGHCTHSWIGGFAARLIECRPHIGMISAVTRAVASFHHAADLHPHRAVEIYLLSLSFYPNIAPPRRKASKRLVSGPIERIREAVSARI